MKILEMKQKEKDIIPVFFAVDDNYIPYLCIALRSLIDNSSKKHDYRIHILIDSLKDENKQLLRSMQTENITLEFVSVSGKLREICARLHMRDYYTKATYYRFFVPELFAQYDKGIYLDCDIVITSDIAELYHCRMGHNLVAAVTDEIITDIDIFARYSETVLSIPRNDYFNAGILVMNLKEMRRIEIEKKFAELLSARAYPVAQDQDYLNKICHGKVYYLSKRWNKTPMPDSDESITPKIAHYKINFKPWRYDNIPYSGLFWNYAAKTPFFEYLKGVKASYTKEEMQRDTKQYNSLMALAREEIENEEASRASLDLVFAEI